MRWGGRIHKNPASVVTELGVVRFRLRGVTNGYLFYNVKLKGIDGLWHVVGTAQYWCGGNWTIAERIKTNRSTGETTLYGAAGEGSRESAARQFIRDFYAARTTTAATTATTGGDGDDN